MQVLSQARSTQLESETSWFDSCTEYTVDTTSPCQESTVSLAVRDDIRLAGRVSRWHTWPHIREQSVAEHTWQVLRILMAIWPGVLPGRLTAYVVAHDIGEIRVGDPPYPIKADNPVLKREMDRLEGEAQGELCADWMLDCPPSLTETERFAFKLAEFIEMWEWGWEEELLGNRFAIKVKERCLDVAMKKFIEPHRGELADSSRAIIASKALSYIALRTKKWIDA